MNKLLFVFLLTLCLVYPGKLLCQNIVQETSEALCRGFSNLDLTVHYYQLENDVGFVYDTVMGARRSELVKYVEQQGLAQGGLADHAVVPVSQQILAGLYQNSENFKRVALFRSKPIPTFDPLIITAGTKIDSLLVIAEAEQLLNKSTTYKNRNSVLREMWPAAARIERYKEEGYHMFEHDATQWLLAHSVPFQAWRIRELPIQQSPIATRLMEYVEDERIRRRDAMLK